MTTKWWKEERPPGTIFLDYNQNAASYTKAGLWSPFEEMLGDDEGAERTAGVRATAEIFEVLGLKPVLVGAVGQDFADYRSWLDRHGVDTASARIAACSWMPAMTFGCWWPMLVLTSCDEKSR